MQGMHQTLHCKVRNWYGFFSIFMPGAFEGPCAPLGLIKHISSPPSQSMVLALPPFLHESGPCRPWLAPGCRGSRWSPPGSWAAGPPACPTPDTSPGPTRLSSAWTPGPGARPERGPRSTRRARSWVTEPSRHSSATADLWVAAH